jgi:hypothetical protein
MRNAIECIDGRLFPDDVWSVLLVNKRQVVGALLSAAVVTFTGVGVTGTASAAPGNGATVTWPNKEDEGCSLGFLGDLTTCTLQVVRKPTGEILFNFKGQLYPSVAPPRATPINAETTGLPCTDDYPNFVNGVLTPSGKATWTCSS